MNRKNRRALRKKLKNNGANTLAANVLESLGKEVNNFIRDGDLVTLNVKRIMGRKEYSRMQEQYKKFVESNRDTVFVAHPRRARPDGFSAVIELEGVFWTFWYGDLLRVKNNQVEEVD